MLTGRSNVVGQFDHGHPGLVGFGYGATHVRPVAAKTVRSDKAVDIAHHDEEHHRASRLPADRDLFAVVRWRQDVGHTDGPRRRVWLRAYATFHSHFQHVCHDDAVQRDQRPKNTRAAQRVPGVLHQPDILQHMDRYGPVTSVHHPVRKGRVQHQKPDARTVDVVFVVRFWHALVGTDSHHRAYPQNTETSVVSKPTIGARLSRIGFFYYGSW